MFPEVFIGEIRAENPLFVKFYLYLTSRYVNDPDERMKST